MPTPAESDVLGYCEELGRRAREASRRLATATGERKNAWLLAAAKQLQGSPDGILKANAADIQAAPSFGLSDAQIDRLRLTDERLRAAAAGLREIAALPDPIGRVLDSNVRPNGLKILKVGVPLGVILFLYESRPNVTVDAAGLCVKSGNAIILRGGKEALHSNLALHRLLQDCLNECDLPGDAVQMVSTPDRAAVGQLLKLKQFIDLVIPRGGEGLIRRVADEARMPVLKHFMGNCHVYVDAAADLPMAERIILNAKCQRPGVCNAAESLLVHRDVAEAFLPKAGSALRERGVELRGCPATVRLVPGTSPAKDEDYAAEFLDLILSVRVVSDIDEAIAHITRYGSRHTEAIVTNDLAAARRFTTNVDAAAVMVNTSTRYHDGYEFGLGAEIGISTDKIHARGPCGLVELCSYKYIVWGDGQVRGE
jgi:glutamate-5-semialdehyde dehydrogenase